MIARQIGQLGVSDDPCVAKYRAFIQQLQKDQQNLLKRIQAVNDNYQFCLMDPRSDKAACTKAYNDAIYKLQMAQNVIDNAIDQIKADILKCQQNRKHKFKPNHPLTLPSIWDIFVPGHISIPGRFNPRGFNTDT